MVVSRIKNSCVAQAVIVIRIRTVIVVVYLKFEQFHISSAVNKESLVKTDTYLFLLGVQ